MARPLRWLVACERSGLVREALTALGHYAVSCDLFPSPLPGWHYQSDIRELLHLPWDGLIAHPVCKYLTNAGVRWLYHGGRKENGIDPARWAEMERACEFYSLFCNATHIPRRAIENPIMHEYAAARIGHRADQFVHPWWFGSPFQKATGFKLYGLPELPQEYTKAQYAEHGIAIKQAVWLMGPSPDREEKRSETDPQVARAIAQYWAGDARAERAALDQRAAA